MSLSYHWYCYCFSFLRTHHCFALKHETAGRSGNCRFCSHRLKRRPGCRLLSLRTWDRHGWKCHHLGFGWSWKGLRTCSDLCAGWFDSSFSSCWPVGWRTCCRGLEKSLLFSAWPCASSGWFSRFSCSMETAQLSLQAFAVALKYRQLSGSHRIWIDSAASTFKS